LRQIILTDYFEVRIRSEHTIGLLKGTFQSLKELRIQISDKKKHLELILWVRCCIILHNLIIRIEEGTGIDSEWREATIRDGLRLTELQQRNRERHVGNDEADDEVTGQDANNGLQFRVNLMHKLFDSEYTTATRR
jgi:hypothetical protein